MQEKGLFLKIASSSCICKLSFKLSTKRFVRMLLIACKHCERRCLTNTYELTSRSHRFVIETFGRRTTNIWRMDVKKMRFPLCIQTNFFNFEGKFYIDASDKLNLRAEGKFCNVELEQPLEICVETKPHRPLPFWLSVIKLLTNPDRFFGKTSMCAIVPLCEGKLNWTCDLINCETWELCVANLCQISLESVAGKSPLYVTIKQKNVTIATVYIQRKQHCVHFH